jgi:hypothetical protein
MAVSLLCFEERQFNPKRNEAGLNGADPWCGTRRQDAAGTVTMPAWQLRKEVIP